MIEAERQSLMIREYLARFTAYVHLSNGESKNDINHDAETFYCGLLNILLSDNEHWGYHGKNVNLIDMNAIKQNYPAIDLGDEKNGLAIQVSSSEDREKVRSTLEKFFDHGHDAKFSRLIMLIIGSRDSYIRQFNVKPGFDFQIERDIWDTKRLGKEISRLSPQRKDMILAYLENQFKSRGIYDTVKYLDLPLRTALGDDFVGREEELQHIAREISSKKPVYLSGLGGMGKTELAVRFAREYSDGAVYFVHFSESFTKTIIAMFSGVYPRLPDDQPQPSETEQYNTVISLLEKCGEKDILIIDNMDANQSEWNELMRDPAYKKLCSMKLRLLITTRFAPDRAISIGKMNDDKLFEIFRTHGADLTEAEMKDLIDAVNGHTMTIDLIARTLNGKGWRRVTAKKMLNDLRDNALPNETYREITTDYNQSEEQAQIYQHLSTVFYVSGVTDVCKDVMRYATFLPDNGMFGELFGTSLKEDEQDSLDSLLEHGWLEMKDGLLTIHPVIRLVCRTELTPTDENCGDFLDALDAQWSPQEYDRVKYAQLAEVFALAADYLEDQEAEWINSSCRLLNDLAQYDAARALYEKHLSNLEERLKDTERLATVYHNLGYAYGNLGNHSKALEFKMKALKILEKVLPPEHPHLAGSYNNAGTAYSDLGDHRKALEFMLKALEIREKVLPSDHPDLAASYNNAGTTYNDLGDYNKALEYMLKALAICEKVLPPDHPHLATSYNNVGTAYGDLGNHSKALEFKLKALEILEKILPPEHPSLATSYNNVSCTYSELGDTEKDLEYGLKALEIREKVLPPEHPDLAQSYNNVGITYTYMKDFSKAVEYLEKALEIRENVLPPEHPYIESTKQSLMGIRFYAMLQEAGISMDDFMRIMEAESDE